MSSRHLSTMYMPSEEHELYLNALKRLVHLERVNNVSFIYEGIAMRDGGDGRHWHSTGYLLRLAGLIIWSVTEGLLRGN